MGTNGSRFVNSDNALHYGNSRIKSRRPRIDREWLYFAAFWIGVVLALWGGGLIR